MMPHFDEAFAGLKNDSFRAPPVASDEPSRYLDNVHAGLPSL